MTKKFLVNFFRMLTIASNVPCLFFTMMHLILLKWKNLLLYFFKICALLHSTKTNIFLKLYFEILFKINVNRGIFLNLTNGFVINFVFF